MSPEALAWIEKQKPDLVDWAEEFVTSTKLYAATPVTAEKDFGKRTPEVRTNQLRNLLNAAQSGSPLAVLINFLRYQIGRESQGWRQRTSGDKLQKLLHEDVRKLCRRGFEQFEKKTERSREEDERSDPVEPVDRYELESHVAAQLLGFIIREYTYQCRLAGTRP